MPLDLASDITSKTKLIVVNSPSNPTGAVFERNTLEEILILEPLLADMATA